MVPLLPSVTTSGVELSVAKVEGACQSSANCRKTQQKFLHLLNTALSLIVLGNNFQLIHLDLARQFQGDCTRVSPQLHSEGSAYSGGSVHFLLSQDSWPLMYHTLHFVCIHAKNLLPEYV